MVLGFPEPFLKRDVRFTRRWLSLRNDQLTHCFTRNDPTVVPMRTLLSQLL